MIGLTVAELEARLASFREEQGECITDSAWDLFSVAIANVDGELQRLLRSERALEGARAQGAAQ